MKVTILTYDVWGNAEDGYNVNDSHVYGTFEFDGTVDDLCNDTIGFLNEHFFANYVAPETVNVEVVNDSDEWLDIEVEDAEDGCPICGIQVSK